MTKAVRNQFVEQSRACERMGSPLTSRVLALLAQDLEPDSPLTQRILNWAGPASDALPLRLAGGLHALVRSGQHHDLQDFYAQPDQYDESAVRAILRRVINNNAETLDRWLDSPPQTNELRRSAVLIAVAHWLTDRFGLPLTLSEIGASAGLNMIWDHYALQIGAQSYGPTDATLTLKPDWQGEIPPLAPPHIRSRAGVDRAPIDPITDRERLFAYIWADQTDRLTRTAKALDLITHLGIRPEQGEALPWMERRISTPYPGSLHLIYHTIVWQYLTPDERAQGQALLDQAGARATVHAPLAHLAMEEDGSKPGVGLTLTLWPEMLRLQLGRADAHGRWIIWNPEIV